MTDDDAIAFALGQSAICARSMRLPEAARFLRGILCVAGERPEADALRSAYVALCQADDQLELIASPQLKLPLQDGSSHDGKDGDGK